MLAHSLRDNGTQVPLIILVTKDVQELAIGQLEVRVEKVNGLDRSLRRYRGYMIKSSWWIALSIKPLQIYTSWTVQTSYRHSPR